MPSRPMLGVFNAGELSPLLNGRIDLEQYYKGCSQLENLLPLKQGGVTRRPGTIFVNSAYTSGSAAADVDTIARLIPFVISETAGYVWEFTATEIAGGLQAQVYYDHALVASLVMPSLFTLNSQYLQLNQVMYLVSEDHPVYKLTYSSTTAWTVSAVTFTASTGEQDFSTANNYPRAIAFHDDRIILAGTAANPNRVWGSVVSDHENFTQGQGLSDDAFQFDLGARLKHIIQWVESAEDLVIGTNMAEGILYGSEEGITPATAFFRWKSTRGSAYFQPQFIDGAIVFIDRSQKQAYEMYNDGQWRTHDLTLLADHIAGQGIGDAPFVPSIAQYEGEAGGFCQAVAFQRDPHPFLWFVTKAGELVSCTFDKDAGMIAWSRHNTRAIGTVPSANANYYGPAFFRSVCVIPDTKGQDELWAQVTRWHDDNLYKNYIEYFAQMKFEDLEDGHFVDCGIDIEQSELFQFTEIKVEYYPTSNLVTDPEDLTTANWLEDGNTVRTLSDLYYQGMRYTTLTTPGNEGVYQEVVFTGDAVKCCQAIIKKGTAVGIRFGIIDDTAPARKARVTVTWATKKITVDNGTLEQYVWIDDETLWVVLKTLSVTASNTHSIDFYNVGAGTNYITGVQVEDSTTPTGKAQLKFKPMFSDIVDGDDVFIFNVDSDIYPILATAVNAKVFEVGDADPWYTITGSFFEIDTNHKDETNGLGYFRKAELTVSNLGHLEGTTVAVNTDGYPQASKTVVSGDITLNTYSSRTHVGLPYYPKLKTMNLEVPSQSGTSQAAIARIQEIAARFYQTVSAKIGKSEDDTLETVKMREWSDEWGNLNQEPFTGDRQVDFPGDYDKEKYIYITSETATAITILGLIPDLYLQE